MNHNIWLKLYIILLCGGDSFHLFSHALAQFEGLVLPVEGHLWVLEIQPYWEDSYCPKGEICSHSFSCHWVKTPQNAMHFNSRIWNHSFIRKSSVWPYVCVCKYMCLSHFFHIDFLLILGLHFPCANREFYNWRYIFSHNIDMRNASNITFAIDTLA